MRHWKALGGLALTFLLASTGAVAGERYYDNKNSYDGDGYHVNAKVVNVAPIVRRVRVAEPYEMCWPNRYSHHEPYCETRTAYRFVEKIEGYDITYRYQGRYFTTRSDHNPGKRIRVRVEMEPASRHSGYSKSGYGHPSNDHYCDDDCA